MRLSDRWTGGIFAIGGSLIALAAVDYPTPVGQAVGPSLFPIVIGIIMAAAGLLVAVRGEARPAPPGAQTEAGTGGAIPLPVVVILGAIGGFALLVPIIGTIASSTLLVMVAAWTWRQRFVPSVLLGLCSGIALFLFFGRGLRVPLPSGWIEDLLR
jgi:putative tricarboxylic transport membrane protein